jgi:hypothetical protein
MKLLVQWATSEAADWHELDSADWPATPAKPLPIGDDPIDAGPGWVTALNVQGVIFTSFDHYAVEEIADGGIRVTVWNDDPDDQVLERVRRVQPDQGPFPAGYYGHVWTFLPLAPDPAYGGALNTRQTFTYYAESDQPVWEHARSVGLIPRPWPELRRPPAHIVRHGVWLTSALMARHVERQTLHGWQEWAP